MRRPALPNKFLTAPRPKEATATIRVLMLNLRDTVIHDAAPLPHVLEALAALTQFETASGEPLAAAAKINVLFPCAFGREFAGKDRISYDNRHATTLLLLI
jgi:hypothetical protein